jgi:hypothetical protein
MNWWMTKKLSYLSQKTFLHCTLHCTTAAEHHETEEQTASQRPASF